MEALCRKNCAVLLFLYWKWACYAIIHATLIDELEIML